jgi:hypothetical protein
MGCYGNIGNFANIGPQTFWFENANLCENANQANGANELRMAANVSNHTNIRIIRRIRINS